MNRVPYVIALYIRLSVEDQKVASMSVENQRTALHQYVDSMDGLDNVKVEEFVDNGYSGTNFERPSVQTMLDLVQKGLINCIIVKDFSRFGRNSVEVEYYLEKIFPLYNVRFVAINDGYDSDQLRGDTGGINVAFRYLINELYSRDLSAKYKSAKDVKFQRGEYQSKICPYGYRKSADGRMEPDGEAAEIVRLIFELARNGLGAKKIVKELYARGITTPAEYKASHGFTGYDVSRCYGIWHESTVARILTDERYTGVYIIGKREVIEVGGHRVRLKDESEWIKIPNHHPAIVSRELYDQVQALRPNIKCPKKQTNTYPLRGKVFCGCCGHAMSRTAAKNHAYICRPSQVDEAALCHGLRILEVDLERRVCDMILAQADAEIEDVSIDESNGLDVKIAACQTAKRELYECFVEQKITLNEYKAQKAELDRELVQLQRTKAMIDAQTIQVQAAHSRDDLLRQLRETGHMTVDLANALIERINIFPEGQIEPIWKTFPLE